MVEFSSPDRWSSQQTCQMRTDFVEGNPSLIEHKATMADLDLASICPPRARSLFLLPPIPFFSLSRVHCPGAQRCAPQVSMVTRHRQDKVAPHTGGEEPIVGGMPPPWAKGRGRGTHQAREQVGPGGVPSSPPGGLAVATISAGSSAKVAESRVVARQLAAYSRHSSLVHTFFRPVPGGRRRDGGSARSPSLRMGATTSRADTRGAAHPP